MCNRFDGVRCEFHDEFASTLGTPEKFGAGNGGDLGRVPDRETVLAAGAPGDGESDMVAGGRPRLGDDAQALGRGAEGRKRGIVDEAEIVFEADVDRICSVGEENADEHVLVDGIGFHVKRHGVSVERGAEDFGAEADGGLEVERQWGIGGRSL